MFNQRQSSRVIGAARKQRVGRRHAVCLAALSVALGGSVAQAASWDVDGPDGGLGGGGQWDYTSPSWLSGTDHRIWQQGDDAIFSGVGAPVFMDGNQTTNSLTFNSPNYSIVVPTSAPGSTPNLFVLSGVIDTGAHDVVVLPRLGGPNGITKRGTGTLVYHGGNTSLSGGIRIEEGTLAAGNTLFADIPIGVGVDVSEGATFDLAPFGGAFSDSSMGPLTGAGSVRLGRLPNGGVSTGSLLGVVNPTNTTSTFSGSISGIGGRFTKQGPGTQRLTGNNTYTGWTRIGEGVLEVGGGNAIADTSPVLIQIVGTTPSTLRLLDDETIGSLSSGNANSATRRVDLNGHTLTMGADNEYTEFAGRISGQGRIVKIGTGTQSLATTASIWEGGLTVKGGLLIASDDNRLGTAPDTAVDDHILLDGGTFANSSSNTYELNANRGITVTAAGGGIKNLGANRTLTYNGTIKGTGQLHKSGPGTLVLGSTGGGSPDFAGGLLITDGTLRTNATSGVPLGVGDIRIREATLQIAPTFQSADLEVVHQLANAQAGSKFTYGPGSVLALDKGSTQDAANRSLTVLIGPGAPSGDALASEPKGSLVIKPATALGSSTGERVMVTGSGPRLVSGFVETSIMAASPANGHGDFLQYSNDDGLFAGSYSATDINTAAASDIVNVPGLQSLSGGRTIRALRNNAVLDLSSHTLRVADAASGVSSVIVNDGQISGGQLMLEQHGVIYVGGNSTIDAPIAGSNGITKVGPGTLTLDNPGNSFTGGLNVADGTVTMNLSETIPAGNELRLSRNAVVNINGTTQSVGSLSGENGASVQLNNGTLRVGAGDSVYLGTMTGGGTLEKNGTGTLQLGHIRSTSADPSASLSYTRLAVKGGGVVSVSSSASFPASGTRDTALPDAITLDNGTLRITSMNYNLLAGPSLFTIASGATQRGVTLGPAGGTIDVAHPQEIVFLQDTNAAARDIVRGDGSLTKAGPGFLRLGPGNSYRGKTIVLEGNLQFQQDNSLGTAPATLVEDHLQIAGGASIQSNGTGGIAATRGTKLLGGQAEINTSSGPFTFNGPITGPGGIDKVGNLGSGTLNPSTALILNETNTFQGDLRVLNGAVNLNKSGAAGLGRIVLDPQFPILLGKNGGAADSVISNPVEVRSGSTVDVRSPSTVGRLVLNGPVTGSGGFFKSGDGTIALGNPANDYAGDTVVLAGTLVASAPNALGSASRPTLVNAGGSLSLEGGIDYARPEPLYLDGNGPNILDDKGQVIGQRGALRSSGGNNSYAGPVTLSRAARVRVDDGRLTLNGALSGSSGPGAVTSKVTSTFLQDTPLDIEDGAETGGDGPPAISQINVSGLFGVVSDVDVTVNVRHFLAPSEIDVFLVSPSGTRVPLLVDILELTTPASNYENTTLDDEAPTVVGDALNTAPFTGRFKPQNGRNATNQQPIVSSLAVLDGQTPNGVWSLQLIDDFASTTGFLQSWSLTLETTSVTGAADSTLTKIGPGELVVNGPASHRGATVVEAGTLTANTALATKSLTINNAGSAANLNRSMNIPAVAVNNGTKLSVGRQNGAAPSVLSTASLTLAAQGLVDVKDNAVVVRNGSVDDVRAAVLAGRGSAPVGGVANAKWDGTSGITSSVAAAVATAENKESRSIGYALNKDLLGQYQNFLGTDVGPDDVLIRFTKNGDANLDGVVNNNDITILAGFYRPGVKGRHWYNADFNYDGEVNNNDITTLAGFYAPSAPPVAEASGGGLVAVPEPSSAALLLLGASALTARRRKR